jgi:hypothetical protein
MRIRAVDLTELFRPAVLLRSPEFLPPSHWAQFDAVRATWSELVRLAEDDAVLGDEAETVFGGAIVLLTPSRQRHGVDEAIIVDGRHRLVAWQLLIDASRRAMAEAGATMVARTLEELLENPAGAAADDDQRRVVLPSREERQEFLDRLTLDLHLLRPGERGASGISAAHAWLLDAARSWLAAGDALDRAQRLARVIQHRLTVIIIEARPIDNPLRIARQLSAGGTPVSSVDIVGQTLLDALALTDEQTRRAYDAFLAPFAHPWWAEAIDGRAGSETRLEQLARAWLMSRTLRAVTEAELAPAFHRYLHASTVPPLDLLSRLRVEGAMLRELAEAARDATAGSDPRARFLDRMSTLGCAEAIAVLLRISPPESPVGDDEMAVLAAIESWVVRRVLSGLPVSGTGAGWQGVFAAVGAGSASAVGARFAATRTQAESDYWPTDDDLRLVLPARPIALELPEATARVLLDALSDAALGAGATRHGEHRVVLLQAEPVGEATVAPMLRHVLGNLTLADAPVVDAATDIAARTAALIERVIRRWPGPPPPSLLSAGGGARGWPGTAGT